jgi:hypothetical protein
MDGNVGFGTPWGAGSKPYTTALAIPVFRSPNPDLLIKCIQGKTKCMAGNGNHDSCSSGFLTAMSINT